MREGIEKRGKERREADRRSFPAAPAGESVAARSWGFLRAAKGAVAMRGDAMLTDDGLKEASGAG